MAGKIELLEDEEKIHKIFEERWKKIQRNGWTQNDIAKKSTKIKSVAFRPNCTLYKRVELKQSYSKIIRY